MSKATRKTRHDTTGGGDPLRALLLQAPEPLAKIAAEAGVSTRTINECKKGDFERESREILAEEIADIRKLRGFVAKTIRLATYFQLDPAAVVAQYGFTPTDAVRSAISYTKRALGKPSIVDDVTISSIRTRDYSRTDGAEESVVVGLLKWKPFFSESVDNCFADKFMRSLVGSLSPFVEYNRVELDTLSDCFDALLSRPAVCDAVFGLYDTVYRRFRDLDFVPVPGFRIQLGAVSAANSEISWHTLLIGTQAEVHPVVIHEEIGHLYYGGTCGFGPESMTVINENCPRACARRFFDEWERQKWKKGKHVVFVADSSTCFELVRELEILGHSSFRQVIPRADMVEEKPPQFSVGVAVRADSPRWKTLLAGAMSDQLFSVAQLRTAALYLDAFVQIRDFNVDVHWDWSDWSSPQREMFKLCVELIARERVHAEHIGSLLPIGWSTAI